LTRQAAEEMVSAQTGINSGNIRANIQAKTSLSNTLLELQKENLVKACSYNQVQQLDKYQDFNQVAYSTPNL
jgi:hypothetical protein